MAVGSKELTAEKLDQLDSEHLLEELKKAKEELFNLRFQSATGQLESHGRLRAVKKDIARIYTILRERELGIRVEPVSVVEETKGAKKSKKAESKAAETPAAETEEDAK
ncbi:50S ribosomal protein L29 [Sinomonas sp. JGH33]|uniref:Large ribosomal subunit protein uL29 n=1 Tax=Sinomonas terricola TaxID=3110330 RepID=A0ABU5T2S5_9MICC|nr:50S ribosomal protein L29 [Sinomonas sp. JGH33]MEA5453471.1 50S ribosomal protein L29 [Sinomonas sp. JGH33]